MYSIHYILLLGYLHVFMGEKYPINGDHVFRMGKKEMSEADFEKFDLSYSSRYKKILI